MTFQCFFFFLQVFICSGSVFTNELMMEIRGGRKKLYFNHFVSECKDFWRNKKVL